MKIFLLPLLLSLPLAAADLGIAKKMIAEGHFAEARPKLERITEGEPENGEAFFLLAKCQKGEGQHKAALASFEKAQELLPKEPSLLFEYGSYCLQRAGAEKSLTLPRKGCALLEQLLELNPADQLAREWLIGFYRGAPWIAGGSMKKAREHAEALAAQDADRSLELRVSLLQQDEKMDEALTLAAERLKQDTASYMALYIFGTAASAIPAKSAEAESCLTKCLGLTAPKGRPGHDEVHRLLGKMAAAKGDKESARKHFEDGLKVNAKNRELQRSLEALK